MNIIILILFLSGIIFNFIMSMCRKSPLEIFINIFIIFTLCYLCRFLG